MPRLKRLIVELQRRRVYRVAVVYAAVAFVIWQATEIAFPALRLPDWSLTLVVVLTLVGFPIALVLAWVFDISPGGVHRTEPLAPDATVYTARPRATVTAVAGAVLLLSLAGGWLLLRATLTPRNEYHVENPRRSMVIFPFTVSAENRDLDWLRTASVNMLGIDVESWREMTVADLRRVEGFARARGISLDGRVPLEDALAVARDARVGTLVLGDILSHSGTVEVIVRLYDVANGEQIGKPERAAGPDDDVRPLFDQLAAQVLDLGGAEAVTPDLTAATTNSLQAYREYVAGLRHLYRWELGEAAVRFRSAVNRDSTFALAYHDLALALSLQRGRGDQEAGQFAAAAVRHSERLPWREQQHVKAFNAFLHQDYALARQVYEEIIATDSLDAEAWYHLGEVEYYDRNLTPHPDGRLLPRGNLNQALRAFERAVEIDPGFHLGYGHSFRIYRDALSLSYKCRPQEDVCFSPDWKDSLVWDTKFDKSLSQDDSLRNMLQDRYVDVARRWANAAPDEARPHAVLRDYYIRDPSTLNLALEEDSIFLKLTRDTTLRARFRLANLHWANGDYDRAMSIAKQGLTPIPSQPDSATLPPLAANVFIARGQPSRALQLTKYRELYHRNSVSMRLDPEDTTSVSASIDESLYPIVGVIDILGSTGVDRPELRPALDSLRSSWSVPHYSPDEIRVLEIWRTDAVGPALVLSGDDALRDWFTRGLSAMPGWAEAYLGRLNDRVAAARALAEAAKPWLKFKELSSPQATALSRRSLSMPGALGGPRHYYLLARVAQALGRDSLAVVLYGRMDPSKLAENVPEFFPRAAMPLPYDVLDYDPDWGLLSLSYLERARSHEALGDTASAVEYYEKFVEVWQDAEPDLQHYVEEAREGLIRLRRAAASFVEDGLAHGR